MRILMQNWSLQNHLTYLIRKYLNAYNADSYMENNVCRLFTPEKLVVLG